MTGVGAVGPNNMGSGYGPHSDMEYFRPLGQQPLPGQKKDPTLQERLLSAAKGLLRREGISLPYAALEVTRDQEVVMYGAPNSGPILVCAQTEAGIQNYL